MTYRECLKWWFKWEGGLPFTICFLVASYGAGVIVAMFYPMPIYSAAPEYEALEPPPLLEFPIATTMPVFHDLIAEEFERRGIHVDNGTH